MPTRRILRAAALACLAAQGALAQSDDDTTLARTGVRIGTILLQPTVTLRAHYDDNIFRRETGRTASTILSARAGVTARTDWRRHSVEVGAAVEAGRFTASSDDDYVDGQIMAEGVLDITRDARFRLRAGVEQRHERRGGDDAPTTLSGPVKEIAAHVEATGQYAPGRLRVQPLVRFDRRDFQDRRLIGGGIGDQDDRDRRIVTGGVEVGYNLPGPLELIARADLARTDFDEARDRGGFDRDNTRVRLLAGARTDQQRLISGGVQVGYQKRWSDDPALSDFSGPAVEAEATWRPRRYLTFAARARRAEEETTIFNASAASVAYGEVETTWEVRRFVDLTAVAAYERRSFRGAGRRDKTLVLGIGAAWRAREATTLSAGYRHIDETSNAPGESSRANLLWLSVEHRF